MNQDSEKIEDLYHQALAKPKEERVAFLAEVCGGDEALRRELQSMLDAHEKAGGFMESPALEHAARLADQAGSQLLVGYQLGPYRIGRLLGRGGMGEVYRAVDTRLDRPVALKLLSAEVAANPERLRRFTREAKAASSLNHPNIATIHEIGEAEGWHYIAMEYVEGETLEARIRKQSLKLGEILDLGIQAAEALEVAHKKGIIHRDIKPANLMLTPEGRLKVLDFGLAKRLHLEKPAQDMPASTESQTVSGLILGTVEYMSPEQVLGHDVDQRADLFSLGVVLYDMVAGRLPFHGASPTETMDRILHAEPEAMARFNYDTPAELERIIRKCLEKDPTLRYQHASDLCADLKRLKRDKESDRSAGLVATPNLQSPLQKRPWIWVLSGLLVLFLVGAAITWYGRRRPESPAETALTPIPLTSYPGTEDTPSFSPDGNSVAFQWCTEGPGANCHIYVKQIGVEPPSRLTDIPENEYAPAWSPDGRFIAFLRKLTTTRIALMLIPQRGGRARALAEFDDSSNTGTTLDGPYVAWTPDSNWIVALMPEAGSGLWALYLFSVETGENRKLTNPPSEIGHHGNDTAPAFSPDGRILAFARVTGLVSDLCLLRLGEGYRPQGEPERVPSENPYSIGVAWTPDGSEIVFSSGVRISSFESVNHGLWRVVAPGSAKPRRLPLASENARAPAISRDGKRLAYVVKRNDTNIWRVDLQDPDRKPGMPVQLISSTRQENSPAFSPDGKRIAFQSERSGTNEIWLCDSDGANPQQLTSFGGSVKDFSGIKWSPDGKSLALDMYAKGNFGVCIISANGGEPRRLTTDPYRVSWPCWSRDGQSIYFRSYRGGSFQIWKMPAGGGNAVQISRDPEGADQPHESPNGEFVYYSKGWPNPLSVWRVAVEGGEATKVLDGVHPEASWTVGKDGIYFFTKPDEKGHSDLSIYEFATSKIRKIMTMERPVKSCVEVSPDGRTILYTQVDEAGSDLMLVENFR